MKKAICLILSLCIALSLVACGSTEPTISSYAVLDNGEEISSGVYNYFLLSEFNDVETEKDVNYDEVYDQDVDGVPAEEFIKSQADQDFASYYFVCNEFNKLGLEMDESSVEYYDSYADQLYSSDSDLFEALGISLEDVYNVFHADIKSDAIYQYRYGKDGENAIPVEEKMEAISETYYRLQYMYWLLSDSDGNDLDETKLAEVKANAQDCLDRFNRGEISFEDLMYEQQVEDAKANDEETPTRLADEEYESYIKISSATEDEVFNVLNDMQNNEVQLVEQDDSIVLIRKLDVTAGTSDVWEQYALNACATDYSEEFTNWIDENGKSVTINFVSGYETFDTANFYNMIKQYVFDQKLAQING